MGFNSRQILALGLAAILIINMTLLALGKVGELIFWAILAVIGVLWFYLKSEWKKGI